MDRITLARNAMATRFEFVLSGADPVSLRAAGEEALDEIARIEGQLSLYNPGSEIAQVNRRAAIEPVRVSPAVFQLLIACRRFSEITAGSFDITVAPLVRAWGFMRGTGSTPTDDEISRARENVGIHLVELDPETSTIRFRKPEVMLDMGSIGKGYALDAAAEILRENGVEHALLHGGTSTIAAIGKDPEGHPWKVAIELPPRSADEGPKVVSVVELCDTSLSVSAVWGKHFVVDEQSYGHVIDPRTGRPAADSLLGAVVVPSATVSDALSTAVLLGPDDACEVLREKISNLKSLRISGSRDQPVIHSFGLPLA